MWRALTSNPYVLGGVLLALVASHAGVAGLAYSKGRANGANSVQVRWDAEKQATQDKINELRKKADTVRERVVTEYVDKIVYRDRPVVRDRIIRLCDDARAGVPAAGSGADEATTGTAGDELLGLSGEVSQCLNIRNQLIALQAYIRGAWSAD